MVGETAEDICTSVFLQLMTHKGRDTERPAVLTENPTGECNGPYRMPLNSRDGGVARLID